MTPKSPTTIPVVYTTAASTGIAPVVARLYGFTGQVQCELVNRGFNDTYLIRTAEQGRFMFRLSQLGRRDHADIAAETAFLTYLHDQDVPVAAPRPLPDGSSFTTIRLPEGDRNAALFHYLDGRRPDHAEVDDARMQGRTLARIHDAASSFAGRDAGTHRTDIDHLLLKPLDRILPLQALEDDARAYLTTLAERLSATVTQNTDLTWTRCHGDCHGGNARIIAAKGGGEEAAFFDFDDGGFGYLAYDLAVYLWAHTAFGGKLVHIWHAFMNGYREVRPVAPNDLEAVHAFVMIRHFWLMGEYAWRAPEWGTENLSPRWLNTQIDFLRRWEEDRLSPGLLKNLRAP